jgi:hypothetical protein
MQVRDGANCHFESEILRAFVQDRDFARHAVQFPGSAQISQLIGFVSDLSLRFMGDKSPKSKNKQASQKQAKAAAVSQNKKGAVSGKQVEKPRK